MENHLVSVLKKELENKKLRNSAYSLRSFARNLSVSPAQLSQIMSGKRVLTAKLAEKILSKLHMSPAEKRKCWKGMVKNVTVPSRAETLLHEDKFRLISDWYHLAILSLGQIKKAKKDSTWISQKLGITRQQASLAVERLERMGLLSNHPTQLVQINDPVHVYSKVSSESIQSYHKQILNLALDKLNEVPVQKRDYSALNFSIKFEHVEQIRKIIEEFQNQLQEDFEGGDELYMLSVQLFPLTNQGAKSE
jgi:uncharacterized protein (TIGR02147 family)